MLNKIIMSLLGFYMLSNNLNAISDKNTNKEYTPYQ